MFAFAFARVCAENSNALKKMIDIDTAIHQMFPRPLRSGLLLNACVLYQEGDQWGVLSVEVPAESGDFDAPFVSTPMFSLDKKIYGAAVHTNGNYFAAITGKTLLLWDFTQESYRT